MNSEFIVLVIVVVTALGFDFTNGFHDTANAMATSIATGALRPKIAVALSGILNLVGAFLSVEVALTVTNSVLNLQNASGGFAAGVTSGEAMTIILAGLIGGIIWNLLTWLLGLPSSSSHALIGGGIAGIGWAGVNWDGLSTKVLIPAALSPIIAGLVAAAGTRLVYAITKRVGRTLEATGFRWGQIGTASLVSLAHGTGDAQKTMGVITLALIAHGSLTVGQVQASGIPVWVVLVCGAAIALGTYLGGWRIIRTLGKGLIEIDPPQGMAAEASTAAISLTSSHFGMALSTTHVSTGSILGAGVGRPGAVVRWNVAGRMVVAWLITIPCAAVTGAICYTIAHLIGGLPGDLVVFGLLCVLAAYLYRRAARQPVNAANVNDRWDDPSTPAPTPA